jgi:hypothetical protein
MSARVWRLGGAACDQLGLMPRRMGHWCRRMSPIYHDSEPRSKSELLHVLRRIGVPQATINEIGSKLPEVVDLDDAGTLFQTYGLTRDAIISRLGGSP